MHTNIIWNPSKPKTSPLIYLQHTLSLFMLNCLYAPHQPNLWNVSMPENIKQPGFELMGSSCQILEILPSFRFIHR